MFSYLGITFLFDVELVVSRCRNLLGVIRLKQGSEGETEDPNGKAIELYSWSSKQGCRSGGVASAMGLLSLMEVVLSTEGSTYFDVITKNR